jgi:hypothetical protein
MSSADAPEAVGPAEFGAAPLDRLPAPLDDPLRTLWLFLGGLMLLQIAFAAYFIATRGAPGGTSEFYLMATLPSLAFTFAFWRLLPSRPVNAFYLRSFRHDADTAAMRRTLAAVLGPQFRLSGIRDPRRRSISLLRYLTVFIFALRYATPKYMNLEAGANWKRRLWRSLEGARLAVIDVRDLTPFVAQEIQLCFRCLGPERILFVGDARKDAGAWESELRQVLNLPSDGDPIHLTMWHEHSASGRRAFESEVRRFAAGLPAEPAGLRRDAFPLGRPSAAIDDAPGGSGGWVWLELLFGLAVAWVLWTALRKNLNEATGVLTGRGPQLAWLLPFLVVPVLGLALFELWLLLLYLKDCGRFLERCLTVATFGFAFFCLVYPAVQKVRESAARAQSRNDLKHLAVALYGCDHRAGLLRGAAICDRTGRPLLSWRVAALPFLEQDELYKEFHLDEPWDSPHNASLIGRMPRVYAMPWGGLTPAQGQTCYRVFVSPPGARGQAAFTKGAPSSLARLSVPIILVVEAADAVPWTKPDELEYDPNGPLPELGGHFSGEFQAALADGTVIPLRSDEPEAALRQRIERGRDEVFQDR